MKNKMKFLSVALLAGITVCENSMTKDTVQQCRSFMEKCINQTKKHKLDEIPIGLDACIKKYNKMVGKSDQTTNIARDVCVEKLNGKIATINKITTKVDGCYAKLQERIKNPTHTWSYFHQALLALGFYTSDRTLKNNFETLEHEEYNALLDFFALYGTCPELGDRLEKIKCVRRCSKNKTLFFQTGSPDSQGHKKDIPLGSYMAACFLAKRTREQCIRGALAFNPYYSLFYLSCLATDFEKQMGEEIIEDI